MAFALPLLKPKAIDVSDLPLFDFQKFFNKEEIGKGGFFLLTSFFWIGAAFIRGRRLLELIRYLFVC